MLVVLTITMVVIDIIIVGMMIRLVCHANFIVYLLIIVIAVIIVIVLVLSSAVGPSADMQDFATMHLRDHLVALEALQGQSASAATVISYRCDSLAPASRDRGVKRKCETSNVAEPSVALDLVISNHEASNGPIQTREAVFREILDVMETWHGITEIKENFYLDVVFMQNDLEACTLCSHRVCESVCRYHDVAERNAAADAMIVFFRHLRQLEPSSRDRELEAYVPMLTFPFASVADDVSVSVGHVRRRHRS